MEGVGAGAWTDAMVTLTSSSPPAVPSTVSAAAPDPDDDGRWWRGDLREGGIWKRRVCHDDCPHNMQHRQQQRFLNEMGI